MKKTVKSLIIAASVAAIAGIGAVSFAAWNTNVNTTAKNDATLGSVTISGGFVKHGENTYEALTTTDTNLVPYDQGSGTVALVFNIPDYQVVKDTAYTLTLTATGLQSGSTFKYQIGDAAATGPADATEYASWGTALGAAAVSETPTADATVTGKKMTVILDSSNFADMGASVTFTLTYAEA
ncbi:MAG: hypothetical protein K2K13_06720 [Clostridiales bacterium]|nr:hypothetical protein [Clostridiales bacterium]